MSITIRDPLELLPYKAGTIGVTQKEKEAQAAQELDTRQKPLVIGQPIPIVFCRRLDNNGGVWISPSASEGRFENDAGNKLTAYYQLVLSEGQLPNIPLRDLYQGPCAVGEYLQNYNARAGSWMPGNFVSPVSNLIDTVQFTFDTPWDPNATWYNATQDTQYGGWRFIVNGVEHYYSGGPVGPLGSVTSTRIVTDAMFTYQKTPLHCGTSGIYTNLSTLSFNWTFPNNNDKWDRQIHAFIRNGMQVTRILDSTFGPSNNIVDLALYLINQSSRLPSELIDTTAMTLAANFTNTNSFLYNGEFKESSNLGDWLQDIAPKFLLRISDKNGKKGFRPLLPINNDYTIKTTAVSWVFTFTEDHLLPDGFDIQYISLDQRKPICALMLWRYQPENDIGVIRSAEVRFTGEAAAGPFEQYDLSQFCTNETHAIKVGAYYVARRKYITHSLRIRVKPDTYGDALTLGDLVRVRLMRETNPDSTSYHDFLYQVETIVKTISGVVELELIHFPVDGQGRSLVALAVAEATGPGFVLPTGRTDFSCSLNTSTTPIGSGGTPVPNPPDPEDYETQITPPVPTPQDETQITPPVPTPQESDGSNTYAEGEAPPEGDIGNPGYPAVTGELSNNKAEGETITATGICPGAYIQWYRCPKGTDPANASLVCEEVSAGTEVFTYTLTGNDIDHEIVGVGRCPDPSTPDGLGEAFVIGKSEPIEPDVTQYSFARLVWTATPGTGGDPPYSNTSCWISISPGDYLTVGSAQNFNTGVRFEDNGTVQASPIGPIPWRISVSATQYSYNDTSYIVLGTLGKNDNGSIYSGFICPGQAFLLPTAGLTPSQAPNAFRSASITGTWEFSNDGATVLRTWQGRDS